MTHPTLGPSPHAHSENLVLQSCSSSPVSSTEKATWSPAKTTSNALAVSWCRKTAGVPCLWMILKGKPPLSTYYDQNSVNLFEISSFLTSSCHISSTHPSQPPRCQVSYPKRWFWTYLQPRVKRPGEFDKTTSIVFDWQNVTSKGRQYGDIVTNFGTNWTFIRSNLRGLVGFFCLFEGLLWSLIGVTPGRKPVMIYIDEIDEKDLSTSTCTSVSHRWRSTRHWNL